MARKKVPQPPPAEQTAAPDILVCNAAGDVTRARVALWVLDQAHYGELCFLGMQPGSALGGGPKGTPPSWASRCEDLTNADVRDWLEDMCVRTLGDALADAARSLKQAKAALPANPEAAV
jgi:hypothetical protein